MRQKSHELLESNVGKIDRVIRVLASIALVSVIPYLYSTEIAEGMSVIGAILLFSTGLVEHCPVYAILGISSITTNLEIH